MVLSWHRANGRKVVGERNPRTRTRGTRDHTFDLLGNRSASSQPGHSASTFHHAPCIHNKLYSHFKKFAYGGISSRTFLFHPLMDAQPLALAHINSLATLHLPRRAPDNDHVWFFDTLIPCYYNPDISPIVCSMRCDRRHHGTTRPGAYHIIATARQFNIKFSICFLTSLRSDRTISIRGACPKSPATGT